MYRGKIGAGLGFLCLTVAGYLFYILPGLVLHAICIFNAYNGGHDRTGARPAVSAEPALPSDSTAMTLMKLAILIAVVVVGALLVGWLTGTP